MAESNELRIIKSGEKIDFSNGKVQPNAKGLEDVVLGAVMIDKEALATSVELLEPVHFYVPLNKMIFEAILQLFENSLPVDLLTVTEQMKKNGTIEKIGGSKYLVNLTIQISSAANIETYCRIILEKAIQRELIRISSDIATQAFKDTTDVFELLDYAEKGIFGVTEGHIKKNYEKMSVLIAKALEHIKNINEENSLQGIKSHYHELDELLGGFQPSDLIILAARPSVGKTALALNIARNIAVDEEKTVAIFSLEMGAEQLVSRLISSEAEINSRNLTRGKMDEQDYERLVNNLTKLEKSKIFIDDNPTLTTFELRSKCRRLKSNHNLELVLIDYLQLMHSSSEKGNREQEISSISRALKSLAKELKIPIIALSQLSRSVESRTGENRKPILSDLRESGAIEQDADVVMFIHRDDYTGITEDDEGNNIEGLAEVLVRKHRNGPTGNVTLMFEKDYTRFKNFNKNTNLTQESFSIKPSQLNTSSIAPDIDDTEDYYNNKKNQEPFDDNENKPAF